MSSLMTENVLLLNIQAFLKVFSGNNLCVSLVQEKNIYTVSKQNAHRTCTSPNKISPKIRNPKKRVSKCTCHQQIIFFFFC